MCRRRRSVRHRAGKDGQQLEFTAGEMGRQAFVLVIRGSIQSRCLAPPLCLFCCRTPFLHFAVHSPNLLAAAVLAPRSCMQERGHARFNRAGSRRGGTTAQSWGLQVRGSGLPTAAGGSPGSWPCLTVMAVPPITPRAISRACGAVRPKTGTPPARQDSEVTMVLTNARTTTISNTGMWPCSQAGVVCRRQRWRQGGAGLRSLQTWQASCTACLVCGGAMPE